MALRPIGDLATLSDLTDVEESTLVSLGLDPSVAETVAGTEQLQAPVTLEPSVAEALGLVEEASTPVVLAPAATETASATEAAQSPVVLSPSISEVIGRGETVSAPIDLSPSAMETGGAVETGSSPITISPGVTETVATGTPIVDDFEDGDLSEWGGTSQSGVTQSPVKEGTYAAYVDSGISGRGIGSNSGLDNYPSPGDEFACWVYITSLSDREPGFGWALNESVSNLGDQNGFIEAQSYYLWWRDGNLQLMRGDGNGRTLLNDASTTYGPSNEWIDFRTSWATDGTMTCEVRDVNGNTIEGPFQATDTTYTSGGVTVGTNQNNTDGQDYFDHYRITGSV